MAKINTERMIEWVKQEYNELIVEQFDFSGFHRLYKASSIWGEPIYKEREEYDEPR